MDNLLLNTADAVMKALYERGLITKGLYDEVMASLSIHR